jgi:Ca2+-binding EF-hand superfamily protein
MISVIDDDGNGDIDLQEFYSHYREINEILMQNR